jgi:hypothetical protein
LADNWGRLFLCSPALALDLGWERLGVARAAVRRAHGRVVRRACPEIGREEVRRPTALPFETVFALLCIITTLFTMGNTT